MDSHSLEPALEAREPGLCRRGGAPRRGSPRADRRAPTSVGNGFSRVVRTRHGGAFTRSAVSVIVLSLVFLVFAVSTVGCGGGKPSADVGTAPNSSDSGGSTTPAAVAETLRVPRDFTVDNQTPMFFKEALEEKAPIIVLMYEPGQELSNKVKDEIAAVEEGGRFGSTIFLVLDVNNEDYVYGLADQFNASYLPHVAVLDGRGRVIREFSGFVERKLIEQALLDASSS